MSSLINECRWKLYLTRTLLHLAIFLFESKSKRVYAGEGRGRERIFFPFIYLFWEREREQGRGGKRGRKRVPRRLCAVSTEPNARPYPRNREIMTWAETKGWMLNLLNHPCALRKRETERDRHRERESQAGSMPSLEPDSGLNPMTLGSMTWAEIMSWMLNWLSHPSAPHLAIFFFKCFYFFLRERERAGEGQRERGTKDLKQAPRW